MPVKPSQCKYEWFISMIVDLHGWFMSMVGDMDIYKLTWLADDNGAGCYGNILHTGDSEIEFYIIANTYLI